MFPQPRCSAFDFNSALRETKIMKIVAYRYGCEGRSDSAGARFDGYLESTRWCLRFSRALGLLVVEYGDHFPWLYLLKMHAPTPH